MGLPSLRNHEIRPFPRALGPGLGWLGPAPGWAGWALGPRAQGYLILPQAVQALLGLPMGWLGWPKGQPSQERPSQEYPTWIQPWAIPYNARARNVRACPRARARGMNPRWR